MKINHLLLTSIFASTSILCAPTTILANTDDSGPKVYGIVAARPAGTTIGSWAIGNTQLQVTAATRFEYEHGTIDTGTCVEAKYYQNGNVLTASKIESQAPYKCGSTGSSPGSPQPSRLKTYGIVSARPDSNIGTWTLGSLSVESTANTWLDERYGALAIGVCAEVEYIANGTSNVAYKIETQQAYKCGSTNTGTPEPIGSGRSYKIRQYGRVEGISNSIWQINGVSYTQTATTRIKRSPGIGSCVKVEYSQSNGVNVLHEVELAANRCR